MGYGRQVVDLNYSTRSSLPLSCENLRFVSSVPAGHGHRQDTGSGQSRTYVGFIES